MIYLLNHISTIFFSTAFLSFPTISLVNLPMSSGCGDWIANLFYRDNPYTVVGFWRWDINFVFMSISFGWLFIYCGLFWSCLQVLFLWSLPFLWTWTVQHPILWRMVSTQSVISIEPRTWFPILRVFLQEWKSFHLLGDSWSSQEQGVCPLNILVKMKRFPPAQWFLI